MNTVSRFIEELRESLCTVFLSPAGINEPFVRYGEIEDVSDNRETFWALESFVMWFDFSKHKDTDADE